jgi:hypothetical protein
MVKLKRLKSLHFNIFQEGIMSLKLIFFPYAFVIEFNFILPFTFKTKQLCKDKAKYSSPSDCLRLEVSRWLEDRLSLGRIWW